jgi:hypothetical protein
MCQANLSEFARGSFSSPRNFLLTFFFNLVISLDGEKIEPNLLVL